MKSELLCFTSLPLENGQVSSASAQVESCLETSDNLGSRLGLYFPRYHRNFITSDAGDYIFNYWCIHTLTRIFLACK